MRLARRLRCVCDVPAAMVAERYAGRARDAGLVDKDGHYTPLFKQALDVPAMVGLAMIVGGVVVMQAFSATTGHGS